MTEVAMDGRTAAEYTRGALYGLAAVSIWSGWIVVARLGLRTSLTPWDIAALRFGVAGLLLLPYALRKGLDLERLGWVGLAALVLGGGAPVLFANAGLLFAPAAHAGALFTGVMPLMVAILAAAILQEAFTDTKKDWLRADPTRRLWHRLGHRRRHRFEAEYRPRAVSRLWLGMGLLHGRDASRPARWTARCCHRRCRRLASLRARLFVRRCSCRGS